MMASCSTVGYPCKNLYTDRNVGKRLGACEDCWHLKTDHSRKTIKPGKNLVIQFLLQFLSILETYCQLISLLTQKKT